MSDLLSITARAPVFNQSNDSFHERLSAEKEQFGSVIDVGFHTAKFVLTGDLDYLRSWFAGGMVRDITFKSREGELVWNGWINRLALTEGGSTRIKTIDQMANRIIVIYTPMDTTQNPPQAGAQTSTTVNDTDSQGVYGIKVAVVSGGEATSTEATAQANSQLDALKDIVITEQVVLGGKAPQLEVEMRGYAHMADWYTYTQTGSSGTATADTVVQAIIAADPNSVISTDDLDIDTSTTSIEQYFDGKKRGWQIITEIAGIGDTSDPWAAAIYNGRRVVFKKMEGIDSNGNPKTTNKYTPLEKQATDAGERFIERGGSEVFPWQIRPDRLVYTTGRKERPLHITQVTYTAPWGIQINGVNLVSAVPSQVRV